jgi:hypothetical protein
VGGHRTAVEVNLQRLAVGRRRRVDLQPVGEAHPQGVGVGVVGRLDLHERAVLGTAEQPIAFGDEEEVPVAGDAVGLEPDAFGMMQARRLHRRHVEARIVGMAGPRYQLTARTCLPGRLRRAW